MPLLACRSVTRKGLIQDFRLRVYQPGFRMTELPPLTAAEWATTDELWRMLHRALGMGVFTSRKQLLFCVATCWYCCEDLPSEYYPVLNALGRFADRADLPALR